jgi:hypothetical protein
VVVAITMALAATHLQSSGLLFVTITITSAISMSAGTWPGAAQAVKDQAAKVNHS